MQLGAIEASNTAAAERLEGRREGLREAARICTLRANLERRRAVSEATRAIAEALERRAAEPAGEAGRGA